MRDTIRRNVPLIVGCVVSIIVTLVTLPLPDLIPFEEAQLWLYQLTGRWFFDLESPFYSLRFTGGFVGGICTGVLTRDRATTGATNGTLAALAGLLIIYVTVVLFGFGLWIIAEGASTPPFIPLLFIPFVILLIPLSGPYMIGGFVGGYVGAWWVNA